MGRGGGPIGAIFRGVKSVVGGIGKTIMGGLGVGKKKKQKPAPSAQDAQTSVNTQGVTEEANTAQATLG